MFDAACRLRLPAMSFAMVCLLAAASVHADDTVVGDDEVSNAPPAQPNVLLILCDNLGYGDVACYGSQLHRTPHVDRIAAEGMRLLHFYSASGVCTPSRAALMTGCYPRRVGMDVSDLGGKVLQPVSSKGLSPEETTLAEVLSAAGYATFLVGKWHLGDQSEFLPTRQGFDDYLGIPYSDDMTPRAGRPWPPLPLLRREAVIESPANRFELTRLYTEESVKFIEQHQAQPFFLMLSHAMPGSTLAPFASEAFQGRSQNGPYGDAVEEIDWSTGVLLDTLDSLGLADETIVIWTSDNGAPRRVPPQGSNAPLSGWGYDHSEGAMRVPCLVRWPGVIPPGSECAELCSMMDWLPTLANWCGGELPAAEVDGHDIAPLLRMEDGAVSPYDAFFYYDGSHLRAVRQGPWKLYLPWGDPRVDRNSQALPELYNLVEDVSEQLDQSNRQRQIVIELAALADQARLELGDGDTPGAEQRQPGWIDNPQPLLLRH